MSPADSYRNIAAELHAKALKARSDQEASELDGLARCYLRLAEQAEQNSLQAVSFGDGPKTGMAEGD